MKSYTGIFGKEEMRSFGHWKPVNNPSTYFQSLVHKQIFFKKKKKFSTSSCFKLDKAQRDKKKRNVQIKGIVGSVKRLDGLWLQL